MKTAKDYIYEIENKTNRSRGLDYFKKYMESIGNPQNDLKCIHVAGTNGKGSTLNYLRSMLQEAGYSVGTFSSPYIIQHLDRIRINDQFMDEDSFMDIVDRYYDSWIKWDLSMFEIDMMMACIYFLEKKVDICIFEVGLGGRLDMTNIISPMISIITNIGKDHMAILGDTYEKIAYEKAGIIKSCCDCVSAETKISCLDVFQKQCDVHHVKLHTIHPIQMIQQSPHLQFLYKGQEYELSSDALYQSENAALAIEAIQLLQDQNFIQIDPIQIQEGIKKAVWIGRYEHVCDHPQTIIDGAHNLDGIQKLCASLPKNQEIAFLFSALKDKQYDLMINELLKISDDITITHFENKRSFDIQTFTHQSKLKVIEDYEDALQYVLKKDKLIVICGSLYFISIVRKYFLGDKNN